MFLNSYIEKIRREYLQDFIFASAIRKIFYSLILLLSGCYVLTFSKEIMSFHSENSTYVVRENFVMRNYLVPGGYMFFVFLFPGYACEKPLEDANIHIKVISGGKVLLQEVRNLKNLVFARPGNGPRCHPIAAFYEKKIGNPMSFELKNVHEKAIIEIHCECDKIESMNVWLKDVSEIGSRKIWERVDEIEKVGGV